jgi:hypothetical protein
MAGLPVFAVFWNVFALASRPTERPPLSQKFICKSVEYRLYLTRLTVLDAATAEDRFYGPEFIMSRLFATVVAAALLAPSLATAACLKPYEGTAINIAGLKSQLMVTALSCDTRDRYNDFVLTFRPTLQSEDTALNSYFRRHYGRSWRSEHDDYITQLANVQSEAGIREGTLFCRENVGLFDEVLALRTSKELMQFANDKPMLQPIDYDICGVPHHPVYQPTLVQAMATTTVSGQTVVAQQSASAPVANGQKRGFFGNIAHGIGSIF